ncbi:hypothetical protein [Phenylobacterium sp. J367]|uniref:hypothetical protein n=1 Tax=Phenylobacterium sp. J367 TaxID=2898435 RepID=UPI0021507A7A|nr:hypothetical protein [Phenylobacterium sp. J367]MCR5877555.1 hypothetical protein [Phenylobacterium sp. J367]
MNRNDLVVAPAGDRWGVSSGRELLALAETEQDAQRLAAEASKILRASGGDSRVVVKPERRSFRKED